MVLLLYTAWSFYWQRIQKGLKIIQSFEAQLAKTQCLFISHLRSFCFWKTPTQGIRLILVTNVKRSWLSTYFLLASFRLIDKMKPGFYQDLNTLKPYSLKIKLTFWTYLFLTHGDVWYLPLHVFDIEKKFFNWKKGEISMLGVTTHTENCNCIVFKSKICF